PTNAKEVYDKFRRDLDRQPTKHLEIVAKIYRNEKRQSAWKTRIHPLVDTVIKVAKGLHYIEVGRPWPLTAQVGVAIDPADTLEELRKAPQVEHRPMSDVFSYSFIVEDGVSAWW